MEMHRQTKKMSVKHLPKKNVTQTGCNATQSSWNAFLVLEPSSSKSLPLSDCRFFYSVSGETCSHPNTLLIERNLCFPCFVSVPVLYLQNDSPSSHRCTLSRMQTLRVFTAWVTIPYSFFVSLFFSRSGNSETPLRPLLISCGGAQKLVYHQTSIKLSAFQDNARLVRRHNSLHTRAK